MHITDRVIGKLERMNRRFRIGPDKGIDRFAGSALDVPDQERNATPMHRAFYENTGTAVLKWRGYLQHYHDHLSRYIDTPVRILEIGVFKGGSLQMWRRYFGEQAIIFGVDINPACKTYNGIAGQVRIGSQADDEFLRSVVAEMGGIDIVLDDGSHVAEHQNASFRTLFPLLADDGIYICEDTHTAYWRGPYGGGYRRPSTFIEFAKSIVDDIHGEFHGRKPEVPDAHASIKGIHFYNSMVVIEKSPQPRSMHIAVPT